MAKAPTFSGFAITALDSIWPESPTSGSGPTSSSGAGNAGSGQGQEPGQIRAGDAGAGTATGSSGNLLEGCPVLLAADFMASVTLLQLRPARGPLVSALPCSCHPLCVCALCGEHGPQFPMVFPVVLADLAAAAL